jgi:hypothetical protein
VTFGSSGGHLSRSLVTVHKRIAQQDHRAPPIVPSQHRRQAVSDINATAEEEGPSTRTVTRIETKNRLNCQAASFLGAG